MANQKITPIHERLGDQAWLQLWQDKNTPWDYGMAAPPLVKLLAEKDESGSYFIPKKGVFLIPGCGNCHEAFALFDDSPDRQVVGLDMSPIPIAQAISKRDSKGISGNNLDFVCGDFFDNKAFPSSKLMGNQEINFFDVIFDYTFLCALRPARRIAWASRMAELCRNSTGLLVTLMFPLASHEGGPPFALSVEIYHELLDPFFDLVIIKNEVESIPDRKGREKIAIWRRK